MKMKKPDLKRLGLLASAWVCCALNLPAQTPPTITTQPASQTNLVGSNVTFSVAVSGTGPFSYQWQLNGNNVPTNIITVAGNGNAGFSGDGDSAANATLASPCCISFDGAGNLYFSDSANERIRKVDTNGIITTVAGNGNGSYFGDGSEATNASLSNPWGVALDVSGNLYISDFGNCRIRKVDTNGIITTVAGNGSNSCCNFGIPGTATNAILGQPTGLALDPSGNLYFADYYNNHIDKVDTNGIITTAVGYFEGPYGDGGLAVGAGLWYPMGVAFDAVGNLYIADDLDNRIRVVGTNGIIGTFAGDCALFAAGGYSGDGGAATNAELCNPMDVTADSAGNVYFSDSANGRIRKVDTNGIITTVAGNGAGAPYSGAFSGDGGPAASASLNNPIGVAVDATGDLYIADTDNNRIRKVLLNTGYPTYGVSNISPYSAGNYTVIVTGASGGVTSSVATLTVQAPPVVASQPLGQFAVAGSSSAFSVTVVGSGPFGYFWYLNNTNLVQSGTSSTLIVADVSTNNAGSYTVVVTNAYGSVTSQVASLSLGTPPVIALQPQSQIVLAGSNAVFSETVAGSVPFEYSWYFNNTNLIQSGTSSLLTMSDVSTNNAGNYTVVVTNYYGTVTSQVATLTEAMPAITVLPASQIVAPGSNALFSEEVVGLGPFWYSWYFDTTNLLQSGTNSLFTLTDAVTNNAGNYTVVVTNAYGSVTSQVATLLVGAAPAITLQPVGQIVLAGSGPAFSVGAVSTAPIGYLWYLAGTNLVQSGTNSVLTLTNVSTNQAGNYTVVVTNAYGSVTSQVATLSVTPTTLTSQPITVTVLPGTNFAFNALVPGPGPVGYQWQFNGTNLPNANSTITTVAGGRSSGLGDGGAATNASLNYPYGAALDALGNLYIADASNSRIRKVDTNGIITTVAGTNIMGYSGDGGAAINAKLDGPSGVAFDSTGNLYIADKYNYRIRKVDTRGIITTVAGTNSAGYSGDGGAAVNAKLNQPYGVAVDAAGDLYIADRANSRIRKVNTNGIITTVAGTNSAGFSGDGGAAVNAKLNTPTGVAVDTLGNLYIADYNSERIRKVDTNGIISTVAGTNNAWYTGDGGPATNASLYSPAGIALDGSGNLYIADSQNCRIRKVGINSIITTVAGDGIATYSGDGGPATNARLDLPSGVAFDSVGNLYIADTGNNCIREVDFGGIPSLPLTNVTAYSAGNYTVVVTSPYGSVTSAVANLIVETPPVFTLQPTNQVALAGSSPVFSAAVVGSGPFEYLWYLDSTNLVQSGTISTLVLPDVVAANAGSSTVVVTNAYGSVTSQVAALTVVFPPSVTAQSGSQSVLAGSTAILSATATGTGPFTYQWQFNGTNLPNGIITTVAGNGTNGYFGNGGAATNASLNYPCGVAFDATGNLYIADTHNQRVRKVDTHGIITTVAGNGTNGCSGDGGAATNASLYYPWDLALDAVGNLYIADTYNNCIRKVGTNGIISSVNASLNRPYGVALDTAGNLYISDSSPQCVVKVGANGIVTTAAGNGTNGYYANGSAATNAKLASISQLTFDDAGDLYIADSGPNIVRKVGTNGIITTVAGNGKGAYSGDGGQATNASLQYPTGVALDAFGNLYIADYGNDRIRRVDTNGIISTVAGTGVFGYSGDGGAATNARLGAPQRVAMDAFGNLYFGDSETDRIRKVLLYAGYPALTLGNVGTNNAGNYSVVVSGPYGSVTSLVATLTVLVPPSVTNQPASLTFCEGTNASLSVAVGGTGPFTYQWQCNGTNLPGATGATLNLTNAQTCNAGIYKVVINGPGGATSASTLLTVGTTLGVCQNAQELILSWAGPWALQSATNANGPYADIAGATSPFTNLITAPPGEFFRLRSTATNAVAVVGSSPGGFVVGATGVPGYNYAIEISTNLINWTAIQTNPVPFQFIDVNASNCPVRFYRTVLVR